MELQDWNMALQMFRHNSYPLDQKQSSGAALLKLHYTLAALFIQILQVGTYTMYDEFNHEFRRMAALIEHLVVSSQTQDLRIMSPDSSVLFPSLFICIKCRDLAVRRKVIELLRKCPEREGIWHRDSVLDFCILKTQIEEEGRGDLPDTAPLPESARIYAERGRSEWINGKQRAILVFKRGTDPTDEEMVTDLSMRLCGLMGTRAPETRSNSGSPDST